MRHSSPQAGILGAKRKRRHARRLRLRGRPTGTPSSRQPVPPSSHKPGEPPIAISGPSAGLRLAVADLLASLIGGTIGVAIPSLVVISRLRFAEANLSATLVVASTFLALAIGVRFPQWLTVRLCALAWQRFVARGASSKATTALMNPRRSDASLDWIVLSAALLVAGLLVALLPWACEFAGSAYQAIRDRFVWSWSTVVALQCSVLFAMALAPMSLLGLATSFAHKVSDEHSSWHARATGWILLGVGAGVWVTGGRLGLLVGYNLLLLGAALLPLFGSLLAGLVQASVVANEASQPGDRPVSVPIQADRFPTLLRASIAVVGATGVGAVALWLRATADNAVPSHVVVGISCVAMGAGVIAGCRQNGNRQRSLGRFGASCQVTGIVAALSTMVLAGRFGKEMLWSFTALPVTMFAIGVSKASGRLELLTCVASRPFAGSRVLARVLVWSVLTITLLVPLSVRLLGTDGAPTLIPLTYLALGALLLIHEPLPERVSLRRGRQATAVSVAIIALIAWYWSARV